MEQELKHHGIAGQKWGVRNGPPYPLDDKQKSASEKVRETDKNQTGAWVAFMGIPVMPAEFMLPVAAASLIGMGIAAAWDVHKKKVEREMGDASNKDKSDMKLEKLAEEETDEQCLKAINPHHGRAGTNNNCLYCSAAYEMRRRGYNVQAEKSGIGNSRDKIKKWFPGAKVSNIDIFEKGDGPRKMRKPSDVSSQVLASILKQPNGSRGYLGVLSTSGNFGIGAHALNYEVKNGNVYVIDSQNRTHREFSSYFNYYNNPFVFSTSLYPTAYSRLDNVSHSDDVKEALAVPEVKEKK